MMDLRPCFPNTGKTQEKTVPLGKKKGLRTPETTAPATHEPLCRSHDFLPDDPPSRWSPHHLGRRRAAGAEPPRGCGAQVAARSEETARPWSRLSAQPLYCVPEGTEVPAGTQGHSSPQTLEGPWRGRVQPLPTPTGSNQPLVSASAPRPHTHHC